MAAYLTRRLFLAVPTVFGVLLAVFLLIRLVPGDVVTQLVGLEATISPQRVDELRRLFGLDRKGRHPPEDRSRGLERIPVHRVPEEV